MAQNQTQQTRTFLLQVFRNGQWVDIKTTAAKGSVGNSQAGHLTVDIPDDASDPFRSRLYEGEKVRAYSQILGGPQVRRWTGYVDAPTAKDQIGITRSLSITDYIQELNTAITLEGLIYDNVPPSSACVDLFFRAITSKQFNPTDDFGNLLVASGSTSSQFGNPLCYFPDVFNPDGTPFLLASGTVGSFTTGSGAVASFQVPSGSGIGAGYAIFQLPNQYLIENTFVLYPPFVIASGASGSTIPPASGTTIVDYYNGLMYFNAADVNATVSFSSSFFSSPLWSYPAGSSIGSTIAEILDKTGYRLHVDATGKFIPTFVDSLYPVKKVYSKGQYITNDIAITRDRRNVVVCEGFNGAVSQLVVSKATNDDDINNPPPVGLGKRQYLIAQDQTWTTQFQVDQAAYFTIFQLGKRGKVATTTIPDDPLLNLEDVIAFAGIMPEVGDGDLFYVEQLEWEHTSGKDGSLKATETVTGTMIPGRGTFYYGPPSRVLATGAYDFTADIKPIYGGAFNVPSGTFTSAFIAAANTLQLSYMLKANTTGTDQLSIVGNDGSSYTGAMRTSNNATAADIQVFVPLPMNFFNQGVIYTFKLTYIDSSGNNATYRDFLLGM